jgi:hypothetical protein
MPTADVHSPEQNKQKKPVDRFLPGFFFVPCFIFFISKRPLGSR